MGEFSGRPVALKKETAGILMNPSCKYELNFVPLLTFADWNASNDDCLLIGPKNNGEEKCVSDTGDDSCVPSRIYDPSQSLQKAVALWTEEFNCVSNHPVPPLSRSESKVETTCSTGDAAVMHEQTPLSQESATQLEEILKSVVIPSDETSADAASNPAEPCDVVMADVHGLELADVDQVSLLVDMFYLPFECGRKASDLLEQFYWLYDNALVMDMSKEAVHGMRSEWRRRFDELESTVQTVNKFFKYIVDCPNK
ncbi:hypothetical protein COOONC_11433, partial [Cooperia oncophora]